MGRVFLEIKDKNYLSPLQQPYNYLANQPPPPSSSSSVNLQSSGLYLNIKVSPMVLLIIIIFSILFCITGLLHLLVRSLWRPRNRDLDELDNVTALQGQLQQLFNLHDSGVDQSFIDTLPVFNYKSIIGLKDPFDCAVCLCEFEGEDELRLLPKCSHAFHMECIDTWLLSHSTCPLCRDSLLTDCPPSSNCSPLVFVLESRSTETSRETVLERDSNHSGNTNNEVGSSIVNSQLSNDEFFKMPFSRFLDKSCETEQFESEIHSPRGPRKFVSSREVVAQPLEKVVPVKLGKYRLNVDSVGEGSSTNNIDSRRCFSMGSFAYVMNENASLQVPIKPTAKKQSIKKHNLPLSPLHRTAISECDFDSRRDFNSFDASRVVEQSSSDINGIQKIKRESFSVSKTWLRGKISRTNSAKQDSDKRAFSFRKAASEIGFDRWKNNGLSEFGCDDEVQSCNSLDSQEPQNSFPMTLLWLKGRPNKVVHSDPLSSNA
ncbi:hypothetical protein Leryth_015396 [Lithospermum erythrorhizon]|nr:hypothetical protein Leryth_015396 [Lithospermum erythrorhizon]